MEDGSFIEGPDETGINLRAYFDRMPDEKMQQHSPDWSHEHTVEWDEISGMTAP